MPAARTRPRLPPLPLLAAGMVAALLVLAPLAVTLLNALSLGVHTAITLLWRPFVGALLVNTVELILCTSASCAALGLLAAWLVERTDLPGRRLWAVLAVTPMAIPSLISSYGWLSLSNAFSSFWGAWLVVTMAYYPLVFMPAAAALREMDPALEETGRALGHNPARVFARVILPQLRPALLGGALLVALNTLVEFGAFQLLRFQTFTTAIYAAYRAGFSGAEPALLAIILLLLCVLCLAAEHAVRGRAQYGRLARGTRRRAASYALGPWRAPAVLFFILLAATGIAVPLLTILYWLTQSPDAASAVAAPSLIALGQACLASLQLGAGGAALTLVLALPLAVLTTRYRLRFTALLERSAYFAQGMPGIVVALALVSLTVHRLHALYQSSLLLMLAYAILFMPLALVNLQAALLQSQLRLEEAGRILGLGWFAVLCRVTLPLAMPGLATAAAMVFIAAASELTATLLLAPLGTQTLATQIWANTSTVAFAAAAPFAATLAGLSLLASWLLTRRLGAATARGEALPA